MWFSGLIIVVVDFFVLPFRFIRETFVWLGKIGKEGSVSTIGDPELPFTNWIVIAGRVGVTFFAIVGVVLTLFAAARAMDQDGAAGVLILVLGPIIIWGLVWLLGMWLEAVHLVASIAGRVHSVVAELRDLRADLGQSPGRRSTGIGGPSALPPSPPSGPSASPKEGGA